EKRACVAATSTRAAPAFVSVRAASASVRPVLIMSSTSTTCRSRTSTSGIDRTVAPQVDDVFPVRIDGHLAGPERGGGEAHRGYRSPSGAVGTRATLLAKHKRGG